MPAVAVHNRHPSSVGTCSMSSSIRLTIFDQSEPASDNLWLQHPTSAQNVPEARALPASRFPIPASRFSPPAPAPPAPSTSSPLVLTSPQEHATRNITQRPAPPAASINLHGARSTWIARDSPFDCVHRHAIKRHQAQSAVLTDPT